MRGCANDGTHTRIIDRLEPTGSWKIVVVRGVSSGCESEVSEGQMIRAMTGNVTMYRCDDKRRHYIYIDMMSH